MANYETVFIARQDVSASQVETLADGYAEHITSNEGTIARREYWGLRNLAYRIRKNRKGHYVMFNYSASPDVVAEMERTMRLSEDVLRYLTTRTEDLPEEPSVVMQRREERGRGDRGGDRGDRGGDRGGERRPRRDRDSGGYDRDEGATAAGGDE